MGSPFTAALCTVIAKRIDRRTEAGTRILDWPGNPDGWTEGLPLRLCGGLHALVRRGDAPALAGCYPPNPLPGDNEFWSALDKTLGHAEILPWLDNPPQTNEVGRANALMSGLLVAGATFQKPIYLYELGASAGLNLVLDRYGYDLGGRRAGNAASPLQLKPDWKGPPPPHASVDIIVRRGVDIQPMHAARDRERLLAYVWADQQRRIQQLETALALAHPNPPDVEHGEAADWVETRISRQPVPGVLRVVMHSVAWQYFPEATQRRIARRMVEAGAIATPDGPLAWLRFEKEVREAQTTLRLTLYPDGEDRLLARCQAHGLAIEWL